MNLFVEKHPKPDNDINKVGGASNNNIYFAVIIITVGLIIAYMVFNDHSPFMPMPERDDLIQQFSVADEFRKIHKNQMKLLG